MHCCLICWTSNDEVLITKYVSIQIRSLVLKLVDGNVPLNCMHKEQHKEDLHIQ